MNTSYRSIYNQALGTWVAVSELTRACGKRAGGAVVLAAALASVPAGAQSVLYWDGNGSTALLPVGSAVQALSVVLQMP